MRYLVYEIAGWALVVLGLYAFYQAFLMLVSEEPHIFESVPATVIGFMIFRGGLYLVKVGVAARVCLDSRNAAHDTPAPRQPPRAPGAKPAMYARATRGHEAANSPSTLERIESVISQVADRLQRKKKVNGQG